jgi:hypothetical protein
MQPIRMKRTNKTSMQSAMPSPVIRNASFHLKIQLQFFLLSLSSSCVVVMLSRTVTMSGIMMKIAHARNEAQLSSGPACKNGNTKSTKKMKNAMGIPPFLGRVGYIKRTAPLIRAAQFLDSRIYIFGREKVKGGERKPIR